MGVIEAARRPLTKKEQAFVAQRLGLAWAIASRVARQPWAREVGGVDDLKQIAALALVAAAEQFNPAFGLSFSTFAWRFMYRELVGAYRDQGLVGRGRGRIDGDKYVTHTTAQLTQIEANKIVDRRTERATPEDSAPGPAPGFRRSDLAAQPAALGRLDDTRRRAVELKYDLTGEGLSATGKPLSFEAIGGCVGLPARAARESVRSAVRVLRKSLATLSERRAAARRAERVAAATSRRDFGRQIKDARKQMRLTQAAFAARAGVGLESLRKWERGKFSPSKPMLDRLAACLGLGTADADRPAA
jgi:RNA polymerase sigma factor (sigma-70 family)